MPVAEIESLAGKSKDIDHRLQICKRCNDLLACPKTRGCDADKVWKAKIEHGICKQFAMKPLENLIDRVYVINLARRVDRLVTFQARLAKHGWPFKEPIVYPAIEGDKVGVPPEFTQGGGAYGCRMSHLRILQDCLMEDVSSVMILEDDADLCEGFPEKVAAFLEKVPSDWEGIMLGGQHHAPPATTGIDGVVRVRYAQRTHAYIARPSYMKALQRRWGNANVHIDWRMRDWQHQFIVYAPDPWLIGQAGGRSDIRGAEKPPEWWMPAGLIPEGPVAIARVPNALILDLVRIGFHPGWRRDEDGIDEGLREIFRHTDRNIRRDALRRWLQTIQSEAVGGLLPTIIHPEATEDLVREAWTGPVHVVTGNTADEVWANLPQDIRDMMRAKQTLRKSPVLLLRCPQHVIGELHHAGFHPGFWRDKDTGLDMGLKKIFDGQLPPDRQIQELTAWCNWLQREADRDGLIVAAIHPRLTLEILRQATDRHVVELTANTIEDLKRQLTNPQSGD